MSWSVKMRMVPVLSCVVLVVCASGCYRAGPANARQEPVDSPPTTGQVEETGNEQVETPQRPVTRNPVVQADQQIVQGELDKAIEEYTKILREPLPEVVPKVETLVRRGETLFLRGEAFLAKGFPLIAIEDFTEAIQVGDYHVKSKSLVERAAANSELDRWTQAINDCTRAIRLQPDNGRAFLVRSRALAALGHNESATNSLQEAERLGIRTTWRVPYPEPEPTALDEARTLLESGNAGVAREVLEVAILNGTETSESNSLLAQTHFQLKEYYRAIIAATRSLRWNPQNAVAYQVRGLSYLQRGRLDEAIFDLNAAIALDETLTNTLTASLVEARRRGGLDPGMRAQAMATIKRFVAREPEIQATPDEQEQWLLELLAKSNSSQQVEHLRRLLADTRESEFDSLDWLADFLMLSRGIPGVESLRTWLNEESKSDNPLPAATRLWVAVASRGAASRAGINLFADLPEYAISYQYLTLLQSCVGTGLCRIKVDHIYQAIDSEDSRSLRLVMPHVNLLDRQVPGLLQHCVAGDRQEQARIIISRYEAGLNWRLLKFLGMVDDAAAKKIEFDATP